MSGVPVGRRCLFADRRRAFLGIAGVAVALLLMLSLDGIFAGATRQLTRYIDTSPADVFVAQQGVRTMHMSSSAVPLTMVRQVRHVPGVAWASPILYQSGSLTAGNQRRLSYIVGSVPASRTGPSDLARGRAPGAGEIVVDDRAADAMGLEVGDSLTALGREWRVSGLTSGLTNISNTVSFVRFGDFAAATRLQDIASYVLVGTSGDPAEVADRVERLSGLSVQTRGQFSEQESSIVGDMSADLLSIMTTAAFLIGLVVVGLTLYAATLARLREIGVMKALGSSSRRLIRLVLAQAAWTIVPAVLLAVVLALGIAAAVSQASANVSMLIEPISVLRAGVGAVLLGLLGALSPLMRVARVDPATVFRRPL